MLLQIRKQEGKELDFVKIHSVSSQVTILSKILTQSSLPHMSETTVQSLKLIGLLLSVFCRIFSVLIVELPAIADFSLVAQVVAGKNYKLVLDLATKEQKVQAYEATVYGTASVILNIPLTVLGSILVMSM